MTELEIFSEVTLKHGGEWWRLEESERYSLYGCKTKYMYKHNYYYNPPVYQIFDEKGKRVFASTDYRTAYEKYTNLCKEDKR